MCYFYYYIYFLFFIILICLSQRLNRDCHSFCLSWPCVCFCFACLQDLFFCFRYPGCLRILDFAFAADLTLHSAAHLLPTVDVFMIGLYEQSLNGNGPGKSWSSARILAGPIHGESILVESSVVQPLICFKIDRLSLCVRLLPKTLLN